MFEENSERWIKTNAGNCDQFVIILDQTTKLFKKKEEMRLIFSNRGYH